jgi:hypothetical protein
MMLQSTIKRSPWANQMHDNIPNRRPPRLIPSNLRLKAVLTTANRTFTVYQ